MTKQHWMGKTAAWLGVALVGCMAAGPLAAADAVKVKLATLAPKDTSFHKSLQMMGQKWRDASGGAVTLTIYTDGTQGGEADMVRRMRIGQIHAAMLSVAGLLQIDDSVAALQLMPMMFHDFQELDYVRDRIRPTLEKKLLEKGFVVLFWGDAGYVHFFSKEPGLHPDDYKRMKMFVWSGDTRSIEVMKAVGINAVPLEQTDVLTGLQTGLIDVVPSVPIYALAGQFYSPAANMLDLNWVPLVGATVISKKTWDAMPAANRDAMLKAAAEAGEQIKQRSRAESLEAVEAMKKRGLKVQELSADVRKEWYQFADSVYPKIRGKAVPAEMFDEVQKLLTEYRGGGKK